MTSKIFHFFSCYISKDSNLTEKLLLHRIDLLVSKEDQLPQLSEAQEEQEMDIQ